MESLIKLLPEGSSVVAIIVVVVLFLKQQRYTEKTMKEIAKSFEDRLDTIATNFQNQIATLHNQFHEAAQKQFDDTKSLFQELSHVTTESIKSIRKLEVAFEKLSNRLTDLFNEKGKDDQ